jgi:hypothetical protein
MMPPRRRSKGVTGFLGVRMRPSGRFATDISKDGVRWWLRTFNSADEAARSYDVVAWRFGRLAATSTSRTWSRCTVDAVRHRRRLRRAETRDALSSTC